MKYKLEDLVDLQIGRTPPRKEFEWFNTNGEGYKWVSIKDMGNSGRFISDTSEYLTEAAQKRFGIPIVEKGTLLLSFKLTVGRLCITTDNMLTNEAIAQLPIKDSNIVDRDFLYYYLKNYNFHQLGSTSSIATAINSTYLKKMEIDLPSIDQQWAIAAVLSSIDDKIESNNAINNNLEQQVQTLFKSWFVNFEPFGNQQPSEWTISTLGKVSVMGAGGDKPKIVSSTKTEGCPYPIYSNGLNDEGLYGYTDTPKITDESVTVSARGTIGFVCLRHVPYVPIVRLVTLVPNTNIMTAKYLYLWLKQLHITGTGTTQQQLTVPDFQKTEILVPSVEILFSFTSTVEPLFEKIWANQVENEKLASIRDTLLPKLLSGEIDISNIDF